jgi:DNA-directed RNA polymerase specialized sigma24 family protein
MIVSKLSQPQPDVAEDLPGLYQDTYPAVAAFVAKMGGSHDDAKDIFHDALIIFFEKGSDVENPLAYVIGIAKHLWLRKYKHDKHRVNLDDFEKSLEIPEEEHSPIVTRLLKLVESAGKNCLDLLQSFYYERQTAENIAARLNYSNAHSVTVQKHKCLQKLRDFVKAKSLDYESFIE